MLAVRFHVGRRLRNQGLAKGLAGLDVPVEVNPHVKGGGAGEAGAATYGARLAAFIFPVEIGSNPRITAYARSASWNGPLRL